MSEAFKSEVPKSEMQSDEFENIFENAPCGYLILLPNGRISQVNSTFLTWSGFAKETLVGKRLSELLSISSRVYYETHVTPLLRTQGRSNEIALDFLTANGAALPVIANALEIRDADGRPETIRVATLQAASRRRYEQELVQSRETAQLTLQDERKTSELREQFIAVLGHDLRNPLAALGAGTHLLRKTTTDERGIRILDTMQSSVLRMSGLIDNVLDFARGRLGGGISLDRNPRTALQPIVEQAVAELQSVNSDRTIETHLAIDRYVDCDPSRIGQLISNLLGNAFTHGDPDQPIRVQASTKDSAFTLSVSNGGIPIPEEAMSKLFEPFFRGGGKHSSSQGLGLGLHIAHEIATAHGGTLTVTSDVGQTTFTFVMPTAA